MAFTKTTFQLFTQHLGNSDPGTFIGTAGELFYDPNSGVIKLSDGATPGGIAVTSGTGGVFDPTIYYTRSAVDGLIAQVVGGADAQSDTLGELSLKVDGKLALSGGTLTGPVYYSPMPVGVSELTNKAYVDAKVATIASSLSTSLNTSNVTEGVNLYWTQGRFDQALSAKTTTSLAEGTNLYWTQARFDTSFSNSISDPLKTTGIVRSVNGINPDNTGAVAISLQSTVTGPMSGKPASAADGTLYVVVGDSTPTNDGKSYVWANTSGQWIELSPADLATNDARYINASGDTMNGFLTLVGAPTANLHAATKEYVDSIAYALDDLSDVSTLGAVTGQSLAFNGTSWVPATPAARLDDLLDVVATTPAIGQALTYNGTNWVPATPAAKIGDLTDVSNTAPTAGQVLAWNATTSEWGPISSGAAPTLATLLDVDVTGVSNTSMLQYDAAATKWKVTTPKPKKKTMLPDHGHGWGRTVIYGNEVYCAGFDGTDRIHSWNHAGNVRMSLSAAFETRPPEILKFVEGISYQHVLGSDGILYSRGRDNEGQLGTNSAPGRPINDYSGVFRPNQDPKVYGPGITVTNVWSHRKHHWDGYDGGCLFVEVNDNGTKKLYAAGYNGYGQLGVGGQFNTGSLIQSSTSTPMLSQLDGKGIKKIDNVSHITMIVTENGELWGAGYNSNGALGIDFIGPSSIARSKFADGSFVTGAIDVAVSWVNGVGTQSWFLRDDGTVWGSGSNGESNLCNGSTGDVTKFKQVLTAANTPITGVTKILEVGRGQLFMLKSDGTVWATGRNHDGVFGNSAFPAYTNIGVFAKQIQSDIQDFWSFGGEIAGWCTVFWKKNDKMFFSGTNFNYTGGSFTEALGAGYYNFLQPIESLDGKNIIDVKPINKINSDGSGAYRNTMFLTDEGEVYLAGRSDWCHVQNDGDAVYFKTTYKLTDYLGGATENVYVTRTLATALSELSDTSVANAAVGSKLQWDGNKWFAAKDNAAVTGSAPLYYEAGLGDTQEALTGLGFTLSGEATKQQNVAGNFNSAGIRLIDTVGAGGNGTVAWNPNIDWTKNVRVSFRMFIPNAGTVDDIIVGMAGNLDKTQSIEMSIDPYTSSYKVRKNGANLTTVSWTNSPAGSPANAWSRFFAEITTVNGKRILKLVRWVGGEPQIAAAGDVTGFGIQFGGIYFYAWNGAAIPSNNVLLQSCQVEYI